MAISFRCTHLPALLCTPALALLTACSGGIFGSDDKNTAPYITTQPTDFTTVVGRRAKFTAAAGGKPTPSVVWQKDGVDITSQKTTTCTISSPKLTDAGQYALYASNDYGSATSNTATLTVLDVPALTAPFGIAVDGSGNLYVSDPTQHAIYTVTYSGGTYTRSVLAGTEGSAGASGSLLNTPQGLAVDSTGTYLYVADTGNHAIRRITIASGTVETLAGTLGSSGSADGTGTSALFKSPAGVAVDGTYLYVADTGNHTIRRITLADAGVTTFAGTAGTPGSSNGSSGLFSSPNGVAVASDGTLYVTDYGNSTIRRITTDGTVSLLAGYTGESGTANGTGTGARFYQPVSLALDASGNLLVTDTFNHTLRRVTGAGVVTTLAGEATVPENEDETGTAAHFNLPMGVCADSSGYAYVADSQNRLIRRVSSTGVVATVTLSGVVSTTAY